MKLYFGLKIKKLSYRVALITAGFAAAILALEAVLVLTWGNARESFKNKTPGWDYYQQIYEPIAAPLMKKIRKDGISTYEFNRRHLSSSHSDISLKEKKDSNEVRIFIIGESVADFFPVDEEIKTIFESRFPGYKVNIINAGARAYTSAQILSVARDIMRLDPDIVLVLMGNNIYRFDYINKKMWRILRSRALLRYLYARSWVFRICIDSIYSGTADVNYGLEHFKQDYDEIAKIFKANNLPFVVFTLPRNYADYPPQGRYYIEREEQFIPFVLYSEGRYEDLLNTTDPAGDAFLLFLKGNALRGLGLYEEAREAYYQAVYIELTYAVHDINNSIRAIAERYNAILIEIDKLFEELSETGLIGKDFLFSSIHWYAPYYTVIADTVVRKINELEISGIPPIVQDKLIPELPPDELKNMLKYHKNHTPHLRSGVIVSMRLKPRQGVFYFMNHLRFNTDECISLLLHKPPGEIADWFLNSKWFEDIPDKIEPNYHKILTYAGEAARRKGERKMALDFFEESLRRNPEHWETYFFKSLAHLSGRDTEEAEKNLNRAAELSDINIPVKDILGTVSEGYHD